MEKIKEYVKPENVKVYVSEKGLVCLLIRKEDIFPKHDERPDEIYIGLSEGTFKELARKILGFVPIHRR